MKDGVAGVATVSWVRELIRAFMDGSPHNSLGWPQREKAFETAKEAKARFLCIEFICPEHEVKNRLTKRFESKEGISDGRWEIYLSQKESFEAVEEFSLENHLVVDTSEPLQESIKKIKKRLES